MTWNQPFLNDFWMTYSFSRNAAIAARVMRMSMPGGDSQIYLPQMDYLVSRWNENNSQANIYVYGGFGALQSYSLGSGQLGYAGAAGAEADIESRKYFLMGKVEGMLPSIGQNLLSVMGRIGIAPYEAEFNELASWLMIQLEYHPALTRIYVITPLVRFFYRNVLFETGVSFQGDYLLNFMVHF
jgi:hypothetical protein